MEFEREVSFVRFIRLLFKSLGLGVEVMHDQKDRGIDLILFGGNKKAIVQIKVYRSKYISSLENALIRVSQSNSNKQYQSSILILTSIIEKGKLISLENKYGVKIIDRNRLFSLTQKNSELRDTLINILLTLAQTGDENIFTGLDIPKDYSIDKIWVRSKETKLIYSSYRGSKLCTELKKIPLGKPGAYIYEEHCIEILKYLFGDDLSLWIPQSTTDDSLHRFDLIAKISSINDFWRYLARDFKSRLVLFEFKNYTDPIKQTQVYTTEKYLFTKALRAIAFILSRKGSDENATKAMRGALRENGKLIICLDDQILCDMLYLKDNGGDPNTILSDKVDRILMTLSR